MNRGNEKPKRPGIPIQMPGTRVENVQHVFDENDPALIRYRKSMEEIQAAERAAWMGAGVLRLIG